MRSHSKYILVIGVLFLNIVFASTPVSSYEATVNVHVTNNSSFNNMAYTAEYGQTNYPMTRKNPSTSFAGKGQNSGFTLLGYIDPNSPLNNSCLANLNYDISVDKHDNAKISFSYPAIQSGVQFCKQFKINFDASKTLENSRCYTIPHVTSTGTGTIAVKCDINAYATITNN